MNLTRRRFVGMCVKAGLLAGGVGLAGCLSPGGDKKDTPSGTELGNYLIVESHRLVSSVPLYDTKATPEYYKISDPVAQLQENQKKLETMANDAYKEAKAAPLLNLASLPYLMKDLKVDGTTGTVTLTPGITPEITNTPYDKINEISKYAFNANAGIISMFDQYLESGKHEDNLYKLFSEDGDSLDILKLWRNQGVSIDLTEESGGFGVTVANVSKDNRVMFFTATFKTDKDKDAFGQQLVGDITVMYRDISSGGTPVWAPVSITGGTIYPPTGEKEFYYAGNDKHRGGNASHVWIEKKGVPLISEAIPYIGKGMTVDKLAREVMGYNNGLDERIVNEQKEGGGKVIVLTRGKVHDYKFPVVNYAHTRLGGRIAPDKFDDLRAIYEHPDENMDTVIISDAIENGISNGFAYLLEVRGGIIQVQDGFGWPDDRIMTPADGKLELVVP